MSGTLETSDHSFKLKIMLNTTVVWFVNVIVRVLKTMWVNPWEMLFLRWAEYEDPNKQSEPAKYLKYFTDHQFEWKVLTRVPKYTRKR